MNDSTDDAGNGRMDDSGADRAATGDPESKSGTRPEPDPSYGIDPGAIPVDPDLGSPDGADAVERHE